MLFEDLPDEWKEWIDLTPIERFRQSEKIFAQYLAMGGSLDPDPDPTSPFYELHSDLCAKQPKDRAYLAPLKAEFEAFRRAEREDRSTK
jgi:hypothetical protein